MKYGIVLFFILISLNALSQSYIVMSNGMVITIDKEGHSYDFGHYAYPHKITLRGGRYFVEEGNILATIDDNGFLFRKYESIPEKIKGRGINYFISGDGIIYVIDNLGYLKFTEDKNFQNAQFFGGNYFSVISDDEEPKISIYTVSDKGEVIKSSIEDLHPNEIVSYGGNYFMNNKGILYTIDQHGSVFLKSDFRVGLIQKRGGNFFVDSAGYFFTISSSGELKMPPLPYSMNVHTIQKMGSNYFIDQNGRLYVITKDGLVYEKTMTDFDFRWAQVLSL